MKPRTCTFDIKFHFTLHSLQPLDSVCTKSVISFSKDDKYSLVLGTWRTQPRFNTALTCKYRQILYRQPNKIAGNIISTHKSFISRKFASWATGEQIWSDYIWGSSPNQVLHWLHKKSTAKLTEVPLRNEWEDSTASQSETQDIISAKTYRITT